MALTVSVDEIVRCSRNPLLAVRPHWKRIRLREIATVLNGFAFKSTQFIKGEGMPLIRIRDVGSDSTDTNYVGEFDERYSVEPGDLLVGMDGDFNCARWRGPRGLLNQRVCKVTLQSDHYHPRFLDFALPGYLKAINDATSSVTVKHLSSRTIEDIPLPFPPLREQEEIVAELEKHFSRLDEAVANLKRVKANLKRYKAAVLKAAVEGRLVPTEAELARRQRRSYESGDQLLERITAAVARSVRPAKKPQPSSESGRGLPFHLPEGWSVAPIAHVAEVVEYGSSAKTSEAAAGVPVLRMGNIVDGDLDLSTLKYLPDSHEEFPRLLLRPGDLLFNRTNSPELVGKTAVFKGRPEKCSFASYLIRVRLASGCMPEFASAFINSVHGRTWVKTVVTQQVGQANVNGTKLQNLVIPLPPLAEQERIVVEVERRLSVSAHVDLAIDAELQRAMTLRQAALQSHFVPLNDRCDLLSQG